MSIETTENDKAVELEHYGPISLEVADILPDVDPVLGVRYPINSVIDIM